MITFSALLEAIKQLGLSLDEGEQRARLRSLYAQVLDRQRKSNLLVDRRGEPVADGERVVDEDVHNLDLLRENHLCAVVPRTVTARRSKDGLTVTLDRWPGQQHDSAGDPVLRRGWSLDRGETDDLMFGGGDDDSLREVEYRAVIQSTGWSQGFSTTRSRVRELHFSETHWEDARLDGTFTQQGIMRAAVRKTRTHTVDGTTADQVIAGVLADDTLIFSVPPLDGMDGLRCSRATPFDLARLRARRHPIRSCGWVPTSSYAVSHGAYVPDVDIDAHYDYYRQRLVSRTVERFSGLSLPRVPVPATS